MQPDHEVLVAGGGLVGSSFACALATGGLPCTVVEAASAAPSEFRVISLTQSSQRILSALGLWTALGARAHPIRRLHISDQGQFGALRLDARDFDMQAMGYLVQASDLHDALRARLETTGVTVLDASRVVAAQPSSTGMSVRIVDSQGQQTLGCALLVAADGSQSVLREQLGIVTDREDYQQSAVLCTVSTEKPHQQTAYERFTRHGPIALLPMAERLSALVYSTHSDAGQGLVEMPEEIFVQGLQRAFGPRLGPMRLQSRRSLWPLHYVRARRQWAGNLLLLGSAAHSIHPNAAQGLNLCLRDAATLAETLIDAREQRLAVNDPDVLRRYIAARRRDQERIIRFNRLLSGLFYSSRLSARAVRNAIMLLLSHNQGAQDALVARLSGLYGHQARLVCHG